MTVLAECARLGTAAVIVAIVGCDPTLPMSPPGFDTEAFRTVVRDVYGEPEGAPTIFMDAEGLAKPDLDTLRIILKQYLGTEVRPLAERQFDDALPPFTPIDPVTREPGVTVVLARPKFDDLSNQITIKVSFVRSRGLQRGCTEYTLARVGDDRPIIDRIEGRPDCPIAEEILESYEAALERIHGPGCRGPWARIGRCGDMLSIFEHGDGGITTYFDPDTKLATARITDNHADSRDENLDYGSVSCTDYGFGETVLCFTDENELSLDEQIRAADLASVVEAHPDLGPTIALLEHFAGDIETTYFILENMKTWISCRWRIAAAVNPDFVDEICGRMVAVVGDRIVSHEVEACYDGETCLIF